jgi:putative ABC transport system ATP-binding protein
MKAETSTPIIEARSLVKNFRVRGKDIPVLRGLDLAAAPGEVVVVRGKSGAGKSVLLWLLSGLDRPDSGEVFLEGRPMRALSNAMLAGLRQDRLGIVFQNFNLVASWTALENVEAVLEARGLPPGEARRRALDALVEVGLSERLDNLPAELSIGQQQRVAVARTLAAGPSLILADEPTGAVDPETAAEIIDMLLRPVRERGATLIVATHGHFPAHVADRVLRLENGRLVSGGSQAGA